MFAIVGYCVSPYIMQKSYARTMKHDWNKGSCHICYTTCMTSDVVVSLMWEECVSTERNKFVGVDVGAYHSETLCR